MKRGSPQLDLVERGAERRDGGRHRGRVERAGDGQADRALAELVRLGLGGARSGRGAPARTIWPGALSLATVRPAASATAAASSASAPTSAIIEPSGVGLGHQPAAQHDELERVLDGEDAGGREGGELAERVAGGGAAARGRERAPAGDRGAEDGGLLEAGALLDAGEGVLADELEAALEQLGRALRDEVAHVGRLGPLSGEEHGGGHVRHNTTLAHGVRVSVTVR